jgi:hypothetical protein
MAITKDDIFRAADEIESLGLSPTLAAVRKTLGGGSYTTISDVMSEWKLTKATKSTPLRDPAPQAIHDQMTKAGSEIWSLALSLANGRLETERQTLMELRMGIEAERCEATELAEQVSVELESAKKMVLDLEAERSLLRDSIQTLQNELTKTLERAASAEARANEITHRADDLNDELLRVNAQNTTLINALAEKITPGITDKSYR